jgi:hypothetical protein
MSENDMGPLEPTEIGLLARQLSMEVALQERDLAQELRAAMECFMSADDRCQCGRVFDHEKPCGCLCHHHPCGYEDAADEIDRLKEEARNDLEANSKEFRLLLAKVENLQEVCRRKDEEINSLLSAQAGWGMTARLRAAGDALAQAVKTNSGVDDALRNWENV